MSVANVYQFGAKGNGAEDDSPAIQKALFSGASIIEIPFGDFRITKTLLIPSNTHISAEKNARIFMCGDTPKFRNDFLLSNSDTENGNINISVTGGIWDGYNRGKYNTKPDIFDKNGYSGTVLNFVNVKGLSLENLTVANSVTYYIRMSLLEDFKIKNIDFISDKFGFNQDGLHFGGCVKNGVIDNIRAVSSGQTNDDMIALNADDSIERVENLDLVRGDIENLKIKNVFAENCYTLVRMLSVDAAIKNIEMENLSAGCRHFAFNIDSARYCRTPLFKDEDHPDGVGKIENISINKLNVHFTEKTVEKALIVCESNVKNFEINGFSRALSKDQSRETPAIMMRNVKNQKITLTLLSGETITSELKEKGDTFNFNDEFSAVKIN